MGFLVIFGYFFVGWLFLLLACTLWPGQVDMNTMFLPMALLVFCWPIVVPITTLMCSFYYTPLLGMKINRYFSKPKVNKNVELCKTI